MYIANKITWLKFLTRWKRTADGSIMTDETGKRVLEFVAIQRRDNSQWAIPGVGNKILQENIFVHWWFITVNTKADEHLASKALGALATHLKTCLNSSLYMILGIKTMKGKTIFL